MATGANSADTTANKLSKADTLPHKGNLREWFEKMVTAQVYKTEFETEKRERINGKPP